ncbi:MAG TPA: hypothetical protein VKA26_05305 [Ignavibacteriaceae bacterium]|nr:hypothetical protein [Ignavibacteriaceae bacterium]
MKNKNSFSSLLPGLNNKDEFFDNIFHETNTWSRVWRLVLFFILLTFLYGVVMGCYSGILQALTAGVKVPVLFLLSLLICFPAFFVLQYILGSKMLLSHMIIIILSGFVLTAAIMVSFSPVVILFVVTGGNYYFLQLLHIAIFILSGFFGMKAVLDALKYSCEQKNVYPKIGVEIFRLWVIILTFVGIQLAWNLQPFLAEKTEGYNLLKKYKGNFYTAVIYSVRQLMNPVDESSKSPAVHSRFFNDTTKVEK